MREKERERDERERERERGIRHPDKQTDSKTDR